MKRKMHIVTFERIFEGNKYRLFLSSELEKGYSLKIHMKNSDDRYDYFFSTIEEVILFLNDYNVKLTVDSLLLGIKSKILRIPESTKRSEGDWEVYSIQMAVLIKTKTVRFNKTTKLFEFNRVSTKEQV